MDKVRIAFVVNNYPPRTGGLENHVSALANRMAELGHDVEVHTLTDAPAETVLENGVRVNRWEELFQIGGLLGFPTPTAAMGIANALKQSRPDIISVHTRFFPLTWLGTALGRRYRIPVLHTEHGSDYVLSPSPVISWGSRLVDWTLGRLSLRRATRVVGVSEEVTEFVQRLAGVESTVFYNATEPPEISGAIEARRHLVFVGRIVPGKGWEDFLEILTTQDEDVTAEILGAGPDLAELQRRAGDLELGDRLTVRGRVGLDAVYDALAGSVLVNPTRLSEGFQTTLLEALAMGARVVTYPVPGAQRLASEGASVTVVPADVESLRAAVRQELQTPVKPWSPERIHAWSWQRRGEEYAQLAQEVIEASS